MDNKLAITVVLVTLAWMSAGTSAQSNMTTAMSNMTTAMSNMTMATNNMTMAMSNMTAAMNNNNNMTTMNMTTAMSDSSMTEANMATAMSDSNMTTTNMTTAMSDSNMTTTNMTTAMSDSNMTEANMATAMSDSNMTTTNMTTAMSNSNMTTPATTTAATTTATTIAGPLTPNTTVETLETPVSRAGCGTARLCAAEPSDCDPAAQGSCFFLSAKQTSGQNFEFGLSGQSDGYLAASLSTDTTLGGNDTTYICANNNGRVEFFSALLDNNILTLTTLNVNSVKGSVNGNKIQCTFAATVPDSSTRASTRFSMAVTTGSYNPSNGSLGRPSSQIRTNIVNLADPGSNTTNQLDSTSTASHAISLQQSLSQGLLIIFGVLGLAML